MNQGRQETLSIRVISVSFVVAALAVFKPFGLDAWQWQAYIHLLMMWMIGFAVCLLSDFILNYVVRMPRSLEQGVGYIIRRNLWFQCINTPLVALGLCLYRHFVMSNRVESNLLSWTNFLETLVIIGFCSFLIGLYWRFKFRSRFLAAELEETRMLNEQLRRLTQRRLDNAGKPSSATSCEGESSPGSVDAAAQPAELSLTLTGTTNESVTLQLPHLLYIEAVGNYAKVCQWRDGQAHTDMLRATMKQMESDLCGYPMIVRCHRAFLVNIAQVEHIAAKSGSMQLVMKNVHDAIPVSRSNMSRVKEVIKGGAMASN